MRKLIGLQTDISSFFVVSVLGFCCYGLTFVFAPLIASLLSPNPQIPDLPQLPVMELPESSVPSQMCQPQKVFSTYSSDRDVIFMYGTSYHSGLELALRSLHATGCRARTILFVGPEFVLTQEQSQLFESLRVEIIPDCGPIHPHTQLVPHMARYHYEYNWLVNHSGLVDRVLHTDAYDIFFQGDPIATAIKRDYLNFVVEPHFIRACGWNLNWFKECFGRLVYDFMDKFIICSGSISGNAEYYKKLIELMLSVPQWTSCYRSSKDQPILNYLVWSGNVSEAGIKYRFTGCDGGFMTLQWCIVNKVVRFNEHGQVLSPSNVVPAYLHQYPRLEELKKYLFAACGMK
jgi:hypothetical protein